MRSSLRLAFRESSHSEPARELRSDAVVDGLPLNCLPQQSKELRLSGEAGEDLRQVLVTQMLIDRFAEHGSEVGGEREILAFVQLGGIEPGPAAVHSSTFDGAAENEHDVRMSVIGPAVSVFPRRAAEFRHSHDDRVFSKVAEINPECAQ